MSGRKKVIFIASILSFIVLLSIFFEAIHIFSATSHSSIKQQVISTKKKTNKIVCQYPFKIMPLGDSITAGQGSTHKNPNGTDVGGYRTYLYSYLTQANIAFDFVGSQKYGPDTLPDKDNEGHFGYTLQDLYGSLDTIFQKNNPNLLLLLIGANNVGQYKDSQDAPLFFEKVLNEIIRKNPNTCILLGSLTPIKNEPGNEWKKTNIEKYNNALKKIVSQKKAQNVKIWFVNFYSLLTQYDLSSGAHPNDQGYNKMAEAWFQAIRFLPR